MYSQKTSGGALQHLALNQKGDLTKNMIVYLIIGMI